MRAFLISILEKYKLQETFEWEIGNQKESLLHKLKVLTYEDYYSDFFSILDVTVSKNKKYIGTISDNGFVMRYRSKTLSLLSQRAKVKGEFKTDKGTNKLIITVTGMSPFTLVIKGLIVLFMSINAFLLLVESVLATHGGENPFPALFLIFFVTFIFVAFPYLNARSNMKKMKLELNELII